jgi:hypothetical protein
MAASTAGININAVQVIRPGAPRFDSNQLSKRRLPEVVLLDAAQCESRIKIVSFQNGAKPEDTMLEFYEPGAAIIENSVANVVARATKANKSALDFLFGAQKVMLEEIAFISNEMFDRTRTEMHLFSEIASKVAGAHSVQDMKAMCEECGQHQIDFIRRDSERLFRHGERMIEVTSKLLANPLPN